MLRVGEEGGGAGIVLIGIFKLVRTKRQHPSDSVAGTAPTPRDRRPFRNAVIELTFRSQSRNQGEEVLSATGRRTEYIDAAGGRRREDYESAVTTMRQSTSTERGNAGFGVALGDGVDGDRHSGGGRAGR
jgi:hypothetical protein